MGALKATFITVAVGATALTLSTGVAAATGGLGAETTFGTLMDLGREGLSSNMADMAGVIEP